MEEPPICICLGKLFAKDGRLLSMSSESSTLSSEFITPPIQARSQAAWRKILDAGRELLEEGGTEALTIAAVCKSAKVAPTAIYARVSGLSDLFWAIYEDSMQEIIDTYSLELAKAAKHEPGSEQRVKGAVSAVAVTFETHAKFLRSVIKVSLNDESMQMRGSASLMDFANLVAELLSPYDNLAGKDVARMVEQEAILRTMYGGAWMSEKPETFAKFKERLARMAMARLSLR